MKTEEQIKKAIEYFKEHRGAGNMGYETAGAVDALNWVLELEDHHKRAEVPTWIGRRF